MQQEMLKVHEVPPSERPPARQTPQNAARACTRTPAACLGVHGDGGDGGVHLVAHEICELSHVRHPLLRALYRILLLCATLSPSTSQGQMLLRMARGLKGQAHASRSTACSLAQDGPDTPFTDGGTWWGFVCRVSLTCCCAVRHVRLKAQVVLLRMARGLKGG